MENLNHTQTVKEQPMQGLSLWKGAWFYFQDGVDSIVLHGSSWSGKETVYFNDDPVSELRNLDLESAHAFTMNGQKYEVRLNMTSIWRGELLVRLFKNEKLVGEQRKAFFKEKQAKKILAFSTLAGLLTGVLVGWAVAAGGLALFESLF